MCEIMRSLVILSLLCYWVYMATHSHKSSISVASQSTEGTLFVNGRAAIGFIDDDFVCATIDWWPPQKCDYGTCSWGSASLLNLVSHQLPQQFLFWLLKISSRHIQSNRGLISIFSPFFFFLVGFNLLIFILLHN